MARAIAPAIPQKMYRHFALVTVALTLGLAMFADGENRQAIASRIEQAEQQQRVRSEPQATFVAPPPAERRRRPANDLSRYGEVLDEKFGRPMNQTFLWRGNRTVIPRSAVSQAALAGYSEEYLASLSEEERALLLKGLEEEGLLSPAERERKSAALISASQRRGGSQAVE